MRIDFLEPMMIEMQNKYNELNQEEAMFLSHHQLAEKTRAYTPEEWKQFLFHPKVGAWMQEELSLFKQHQLKQVIRTATDNERSVGAAQMINSLSKTLVDSETKEGPIIIYTYIKPTEDQMLGSTVDIRSINEEAFRQFFNQEEADGQTTLNQDIDDVT